MESSDNAAYEEITPFTFLNNMLGNAEELTITTRVGDIISETYYFNGQTAVTYEEENMNGKLIHIRQITKDGYSHYIMDDYQLIKTYVESAIPILDAAHTIPDKVFEEEGYTVYEHSVPFIHDEELLHIYRFYMKENEIKRLYDIFGDSEPIITEYLSYEQEVKNKAIFEYPKGYTEERCHHGLKLESINVYMKMSTYKK